MVTREEIAARIWGKDAHLDLDNSIKTITGGIGVRLKKFYADFALVYSDAKDYYQPYFLAAETPIVTLDNKTTTGMITFGLTF